MRARDARPTPETLLEDLGFQPRLTVFLGSAPGTGKTHRLLTEGYQLTENGARVVIGWLETKDRPDLSELAAKFPVLAPRVVDVGGTTFAEFDLQAALDLHPSVVILDELAHANLPGSLNAKRWQDALALRRAGIGVLTAFNIQHLETVAPVAEQIIGFPVREIIPLSFLKAADQVIGLDVAPEVIESRLQTGRIVRNEDIARAQVGIFRPQTLRMLRELMLRTLDDLTVPVVESARTASALALVTRGADIATFLRKASSFAEALDLSLDVAAIEDVENEPLERAIRANDAHPIEIPAFDPAKPRLDSLKATFLAVPRSEPALRIASGAVDRDVLIAEPGPYRFASDPAIDAPFGAAVGDRLRIGYGRLTVYLGPAAGCGKTFAMLERAHHMLESGIDVVAAFIETHGRAATEAKVAGLEVLARKKIVNEGITYTELDVEALLARHPTVALIDELAHTNAPGSAVPKRYESVLTVLRAGISVVTTLNVQHLEGINDVVARLTGVTVRETLPDAILDMADDVLLVDVTPQTLRERLRAGKIYPQERIEAALTNFFRTENLTQLRDLAIREARRARAVRRQAPFTRILLGVAPRARDVNLIRRCARLVSRLEVDLSVATVGQPRFRDQAVIEDLRHATSAVGARWIHRESGDPVKALIEIAAAEHATTIAIEGLRKNRGLFTRTTFAKRLLEANASELLILAPLSDD